jgi:hypothetical protein
MLNLLSWLLYDKQIKQVNEVEETDEETGKLYYFNKYLKDQLGTDGHAYNPSYSGDRDEEDHSSKPAWADPISKKVLHKNELVEWLKL